MEVFIVFIVSLLKGFVWKMAGCLFRTLLAPLLPTVPLGVALDKDLERRK